MAEQPTEAPNAIYLDEIPITLEEVKAAIGANPGMRHPEIVDIFYPGPRVQENGFAIYKPHERISEHLKKLKLSGVAHFLNGWRLR
jgi:hypothetical protein